MCGTRVRAAETGVSSTTKQKNRQLLINGVVKELLQDGLSRITTRRVAEAAGLAQPTFYMHFNSLEEALQSAADLVASRLEARWDFLRREVMKGPPEDLIHQVVVRVCKGLVDDRVSTIVFLRYRRDATSPFGQRWALSVEDLGDSLKDFLRSLEPTTLGPALELQADILLAGILGLTERAIDGRTSDLDADARTLSRAVAAVTFERPAKGGRRRSAAS